MYQCHSGGATKCCGMALALHRSRAAIAERDDRAQDADHRGDQRAQVPSTVVPARQDRVLRVGEPVGFRLVRQEEERVQPTVLLLPVELGLHDTLIVVCAEALARQAGGGLWVTEHYRLV